MEIKKMMMLVVGGFAALIAVLALYYGGKDAAEDRDAMYKRSKVFQDSIANVIKTSMDQAATPVPGGQVIQTNTAQPTSTTGK